MHQAHPSIKQSRGMKRDSKMPPELNKPALTRDLYAGELLKFNLRSRRIHLSEIKSSSAMATVNFSLSSIATVLLLIILSMAANSTAYRSGDIVPMSKKGQYHSSRTVWYDMIGKHCPIFGVNREVLIPIAKPTGFTGADPYKISFQVGKEKFYVPWLYVINRKTSEVPMIDFHLRYSGSDLLGVTAKIVNMPPHYVELHPDIKKHFWDANHWPKHVLVRYTWTEQSEIDVTSGFYVLFGSGILLSFILSIYVLQSSKDKLTRFVKETVAETSMPGEIAKVE